MICLKCRASIECPEKIVVGVKIKCDGCGYTSVCIDADKYISRWAVRNEDQGDTNESV